MKGSEFVYCVIGVSRLVVFVTIGKRVSRVEATAITRDSHMKGKGGCWMCVFSGVYIRQGECAGCWGVMWPLLLFGVSDIACARRRHGLCIFTSVSVDIIISRHW